MSPTWLLAIDPGEDSGWSLWYNGKLHSAGLGKSPIYSIETLIIEIPEIYQGPRKARDADIVTLALNAGRRVERVAGGAFVAAAYGVRPKTWKGAASKDAHQAAFLAAASPRVKDVLADVQCPKGKLHNVVDGVALGQWAVDRLRIGVSLKSCTDYVFHPLA